MNSALFREGSIGTMNLPNRIIRAASHEGLADRCGRPTEEQFRFYRGFVDGGSALVITGYAGISQEGRSALLHMTMIDHEELIPAHRRMTERIHAAGGRIVLQIAHCGRQTWSSETGMPIKAPSPVKCRFYGETPERITEKEIHQVVADFANAARSAKAAGYDGVQIHAAHGYLLSTFLSRRANHRTDRWGGSTRNRFRIIGEVLQEVRDAIGEDFPVLIKLNAFERAKDGIKADECVALARMVDGTGCCDAVEISAGTNECGFVMTRGRFPAGAIVKYMRPYCHLPSAMKLVTRYLVAPVAALRQPRFVEGYNLDTAAQVKAAVSIPVVTLGGMRSKSFMERAIAEGKTDFISMARPLLCEQDLPNKFRDGTSDAAECDNCNECVVAADTRAIRCYKREAA